MGLCASALMASWIDSATHATIVRAAMATVAKTIMMCSPVRVFKKVVFVGAVLLASCGGGEAPTLPPADAYETYLANNPDPSIVLSREDAQTRAFLNCAINPQPGTIDFVLREAYRVRCAKG